MEDIIRQAIKEFDYPECTIFKQLVQTIAPVEKVTDLELFLWFFFLFIYLFIYLFNFADSAEQNALQKMDRYKMV